MKIIPVAAVCLFMACQEPSSNRPAPAADTTAATRTQQKPGQPDTTTLGGLWLLQPVLASDTAAGKRPSLLLDLAKSRFTGNTGCNNMNGKFWFGDKDSSLSFPDKIVTTRMACPGYNEKSFLESLQHSSHYRLQQGVLILLSDDNAELSRWERKGAQHSRSLRT